jgi:hypothetical protein
MQAQAYTVAVVGVAMLSGMITLLAWRLWSARRASGIDQGKTTAILAAAVDGIITIDEHGLIKPSIQPPNACSATVPPKFSVGMSGC